MRFEPVHDTAVSSILVCHLKRANLLRIIFRALQGVGGCGMYSMCMVVTMTSLPPERRSIMATYAGVCMVCSGVLGPVLGGAITLHRNSSTWPWIFWINLPAGCVTLLALFVAWPNDELKKKFIWTACASIDLLGSILLLAATTLLVFSLQEAGSYEHAWNSAPIIASLVVSAVCFIAFVLWQELLRKQPKWPTKAVFPIHLLADRVILATTV